LDYTESTASHKLVVLPSTKQPLEGTENEALWVSEPLWDAEEKKMFCF
jgi:hypothetical protein